MMTFNQWLRKQKDRDDPVGDLSKDACRDKQHKGQTYRWWVNYLLSLDACDKVFDALDTAWQEYTQACFLSGGI